VDIETSLGCHGTLFLSKSNNLEFVEWYFNGQKLPFSPDTIFDAEPGYYMAVGGKILCDEFYLDSSEIILVPEPLEYDLESIPVPCTNSRVGQIKIENIYGGYPPYTIYVGNEVQTSGFRFDSLSAGVYPVRIVDDFGCEYFDTVEVLLVPDIPIVKLDLPDTIKCNRLSINLNSSGSSDGIQYAYLWSSNQGQNLDTTNSRFPDVYQPGTYYLEIVNTKTGCSELDSVVVVEDVEKPSVMLVSDGDINCNHRIALVSAIYSDDSSSVDLEWTASNGGLSLLSSNRAITNKGGEILVEMTLLRNGCKDTATIEIHESLKAPILDPGFPDTLNCVRLSAWLSGQTDADSSAQYRWYNDAGDILNQMHTDSIKVDLAGRYLWVVTDTLNGCKDSIWFGIVQDTLHPRPEAGEDGLLTCKDSVYRSNVVVADCDDCGYKWMTSSGQILGPDDEVDIVANASGWYVIEVVNKNNGCLAIDSVYVDEADRPTDFLYSLIDPTCQDSTGQIVFDQIIGGTQPFTYSIDGGRTFLSNREYRDLGAGSYNLQIKDAYDCILKYDTAISKIVPIDIVIWEREIHLEFGDSFNIQVYANLPDLLIDTIVWDPREKLSCFNCLNPIAKPLKTGYYWVRVEDSNGCVDEEWILFIVDRKLKVFIPNVFTPNEDGNNDGFTAFTDEKQTRGITRFLIFDRWGELIFQTKDIPVNDPSVGWKGDLSGEPMLPAVFTYLIEIEFIDGEKRLFSGDVTLIK
jgi:gliding motility-associated-like protein